MVVILETAWDMYNITPSPPRAPLQRIIRLQSSKFQVLETTQKHGNGDKELLFFPTASSPSSLTPRPGWSVLSLEDKLSVHIPVNQKGGDELSKSWDSNLQNVGKNTS